MQRWILDNIISKGKVHGCANGFINGKSIVTNARMHIGQRFLLKIDIQDFFPSIKINWIIRVFLSMGYSRKVAFYLASLCCYNEHLPQGSPASPMLSNIVAYHLDRRLYRLAKKFGLKFSRYADDIAFSGEAIDRRFINYVFNIIRDCGFKPNKKKTRLYNGNGKRILTGISIGDEALRLPRDYRRELEQELHYIKRFGMWNHMEHNKISNPNYPQSIFGKVNFWLMVEPDNDFAKEMRRLLLAYLP